MSFSLPSPVEPTEQPRLRQALQTKLARRERVAGRFGELAALGLQLGLIQGTLKPRLRAPQLLIAAGDHGLGVELGRAGQMLSVRQAEALLSGQLPLAVFAFKQNMTLTLVDAGLGTDLAPSPALLSRKIAHGTRNAKLAAAMSVAQAEAGLRAGMEIATGLPGNLLACAGLGMGGPETAALLLSRLSDLPLRELLVEPSMTAERLARLLVVLQHAQKRHRELSDPIELLAAFGGHETALLAGAMLAAAAQRRTLLIDGLVACAALAVAMQLAPAVRDYAIFVRSHGHAGLDLALGHFQANAVLELGLAASDGTGATLTWPLLSAAAALMSEVTEPELPTITEVVDTPMPAPIAFSSTPAGAAMQAAEAAAAGHALEPPLSPGLWTPPAHPAGTGQAERPRSRARGADPGRATPTDPAPDTEQAGTEAGPGPRPPARTGRREPPIDRALAPGLGDSPGEGPGDGFDAGLPPEAPREPPIPGLPPLPRAPARPRRAPLDPNVPVVLSVLARPWATEALPDAPGGPIPADASPDPAKPPPHDAR